MLFKISLTLSYNCQVHMKTGHVKHIRTMLYGNISAGFYIRFSLSQIIAAYVFRLLNVFVYSLYQYSHKKI